MFQDAVNIFLGNASIKTLVDFVLRYFQSFDWREILFFYKITAGFLSFVFLLAILYFFGATDFLQLSFWQDLVEFLTFRQYGQKKIVKKWLALLARLERAPEAEQKLLVIEGESIVDEILGGHGVAGATFGEKLSQLKEDQLPGLKDLLKAHEIRNNIVHDPDYRLSYEQAKRNMEIYEKTLKELDVF